MQTDVPDGPSVDDYLYLVVSAARG